jgi:ATP-dependent DNA helicase RecG
LRRSVEQINALPLPGNGGKLVEEFIGTLPFELTGAQRRVSEVISRDLAERRPMMRLLQGDVGSGKTLVAALAILHSVENGAQAALMAPTELLAEQHCHTFRAWLAPLGIEPVWLSGRLKGKARTQLLAQLADGSAPVAIGTHALFQAEVRFHRLALVVIDEQHRFGVHQRLALKEKGTRSSIHPHQLIMTATPIPRTLAMTAYADLDTSILDELPPGRQPVQTVAVPAGRRTEVIERIRVACAAGRQAYWVCPLIEESDLLDCEAAEETAAALAAALPELTIGLVHGRMKGADKDAMMSDFSHGRINLLVATTVIEVGVDVPNASLMIIENAERLGLAQLHQLRGRVGRGSIDSACVLLYRAPLSAPAHARLAAIRATTDGFAIARRDLELRGPGEVLGTRQTGLMALRTADLVRDADLLPEVQRTAEVMLDTAPEKADALVRRWLGDTHQYARV